MAQRRRKEQLMKRKQRQLTIFCIVGGISAILLSFIICLIVFDIHPEIKKLPPQQPRCLMTQRNHSP